jgi:hypothetical protein
MIETEEELRDDKPESLATYWKAQIDKEEHAHRGYREFGEKAEKQYQAQKGADARYNILWSNVQVQMGALYQATGNPEVRRRNKDDKGPQKDAAMVLERAISFQVDSQDFNGNVKRAENDLLVVGLGQARVKYDATLVTVEAEVETQQQVVLNEETGQQEYQNVEVEISPEYEEIDVQTVGIEFYSWRNFHWQPAKAWEKVDWIAYDHHKSKSEVMEDYQLKGEESDSDEEGEKSIKITEIYHRPSRTVIVIGEQFARPLEVRKDELDLEHFYPSPKPMVINVKSAKFEPISDFWFYKAQAQNLNKTISRIDKLANSIRDIGFYDASFQEIATLASKADGTLVPVDNLLDKSEGGNLNNIILKKPILETSQVIANLSAYAEEKKQEIYEILGIADIVRGSTVASETLGAQELKGQYASVRMRDKQNVVAYFVRDIFRIMGEIIGEHFEPHVLQLMTGVEITDEIMGILRNDVMRNFSVDIEADSTLARDEQREQQQRLEAMTVVTDTLEKLVPAMSSGAIPMEIGKEIISMSTRGFKYAGNLEDVIDNAFKEPEPGSPEHEYMRQEMPQDLQRLQEENGQMQEALQEFEVLDKEQKEADIINKNANSAKTKADTVKVEAETQEQNIENAANVQAVMTGRGAPYQTG